MPVAEPAEAVLTSLAGTPWRHRGGVRVQGAAGEVSARLPRGLATIEAAEPGWLAVEIRAERLDWLPAVLAALDLPFVIERPDELRDRVVALADRLAASARQLP